MGRKILKILNFLLEISIWEKGLVYTTITELATLVRNKFVCRISIDVGRIINFLSAFDKNPDIYIDFLNVQRIIFYGRFQNIYLLFL